MTTGGEMDRQGGREDWSAADQVQGAGCCFTAVSLCPLFGGRPKNGLISVVSSDFPIPPL